MDTKFMKSAVDKKKPQKVDQHIPPIARTLFGVFLLIAVLGAVISDGKYSDGILGTWVLAWVFIGLYFLFGLKVASQ